MSLTHNCSICESEFSSVDSLGFPSELQICSHITEQTCTSCFDSWVKELLSKGNYDPHKRIFIKCPSEGCSSGVDISNILLHVTMSKIPQTTQELFDMYCRSKLDLVSCPKENCGYRGFLSSFDCREKLECNACKHKWNTKSQGIWNSVLNLKEIRSTITKYILTKNCPNCNSPIQKNGGCSHMTCYKCSAYFCWYCTNLLSNHPITCPIRIFLKSLVLFSPIVYGFHIKGFFKFVKSIQWITKSIRWQDKLLLPFKVFGAGIRIGSYYSLVISLGGFASSSALRLYEELNTRKYNKQQKIAWTEDYLNNFEERIQPQFKHNSYKIRQLNKNMIISSLIASVSALFMYFFGRKNEFKGIIGLNALALSLGGCNIVQLIM